MNHYLKYISYFVIGGCILSGVHYFANEVQNPSLAALCALAPIGLLCAFIVNKRELVESYVYHLGIVYILSLVCVIVLWCGLKYTKHFSTFQWLCFSLLLWVLLQYGNIRFFG